MRYFRIVYVFRLNSSYSWTPFLLRSIFAYDVMWLDSALSTSVVNFFKVLSERWISLFAVGIILLPSIKFLSKLITSLHFFVQEIIDWDLIVLFYFLLYFGGFPWIQAKESWSLNHPDIQVLLADFVYLITQKQLYTLLWLFGYH